MALPERLIRISPLFTGPNSFSKTVPGEVASYRKHNPGTVGPGGADTTFFMAECATAGILLFN
jgi:hypothetical protein